MVFEKDDTMQTTQTSPTVPVGLIKSFGVFGPKYQVGSALRPLEDGDWAVEVTLIETGEKAEYRLTRVIDDPEAH
jgi:hypothetical protein